MRVKLTKDVMQDGRVKTTVRMKRKQVIGWFQGTEIEVSEATGQKLIENGDAVAVEGAGEAE